MKESKLFNALFTAMGACLLAIAGWIGTSVAHIPAIDQKLDDFMAFAKGELTAHTVELHDHEGRIIKLENHRK